MNKILKSYLFDNSTTKKASLYGPLLKSFPKAENDSIHLFVDGGANFQHLISNSLSVGDGDSFDGRLDVILPTDKDISDLGFCLIHLHHYLTIKLYGFIGERLDHQLAVFGEIYHFLKAGKNQVCFLDHEIVVTNIENLELNIFGTFSIFSLEEINLSINGHVKYPIKSKKIQPFSSYTLSNIGDGALSIKADKPYFIFYEYSSNKSHDKLLPSHKE